jgi:small subunit ribosomal protein S20
MAHHASAKKRIRQTKRRTAVNTARRSRVRSHVRKVEEAIASGDKEAAQAALRAVQPELMRGAQKGIMHVNTMARRLSRLSARIKAMGA